MTWFHYVRVRHSTHPKSMKHCREVVRLEISPLIGAFSVFGVAAYLATPNNACPSVLEECLECLLFRRVPVLCGDSHCAHHGYDYDSNVSFHRLVSRHDLTETCYGLWEVANLTTGSTHEEHGVEERLHDMFQVGAALPASTH
jgi:hypothetical protein